LKGSSSLIIASADPQAPPKNEIYGLFAGFVDQLALQRIFNAISIAVNNSQVWDDDDD
jgi:hypothetical protein